MQSLGHVALKVRSLERSEAFYAATLGMPVLSRIANPVHMTFFSFGRHHDFALLEVGEDAPAAEPAATGLAHVAFKIGDSPDEYCSMKDALEAAGVAILYVADRPYTKSMHVHDPDGNEVELYVHTH